MTGQRDRLDDPEVEALLRRHYRDLGPGRAPTRLAAAVRARLSDAAERPQGAAAGQVPVGPVRVVSRRGHAHIGSSLALAAAVVLLAMTGLAVSRLSSQPGQASPTLPSMGPSGAASPSSVAPGSPQASAQPSGSPSPGLSGTISVQSAMAFVDRNHGIVVGAYGGRGAVWATSDEGQHWTAVPVDAPPLDSASMIGTQAWASASCTGAAGDGCQPVVLVSLDGGATWTAVSSAAVTSLSFVSPQDGFGVNATPGAPALLATHDGGRTWTTASGPVPCETGFFPAAVSFADAQHGWVACSSGKAALGSSPKEFVATQDGGATWAVRSRADGGVAAPGGLPFAGYFRGLDMLSSGTGVAWLATEGLIRTTDGGTTWTRLPLGSAGGSLEWPGAAITADGGLFALTLDVASGDGSAVFNLGLDNGQTWKPYTQFGLLAAPGASPTPEPSAAAQPAMPDAVAFLDATHGIAVGSDATTSFVWRTSDGGSSWSVEPLGAGTAGTLAVDGQRTWTDLLVCPAGAQPGDASCTGTVERSSDGGATWTAVGRANLTSISFGDATHGFGVGSEARSAGAGATGGLGTAIYATADGGATWTPLQNGRPCGGFDPVSVSFVSATHGWVGCAGMGGAGSGAKGVMETTDGGRTWTWRSRTGVGGTTAIGSIPISDYLATISMQPNGDGFMTGGRFSTLRTADGGRTWTACPPGEFDAYPTSQAAVVPGGPWYVVQSGWLNATLTTPESRLMRSDNQGATWVQVGGWLPTPPAP